MRLLRKKIKDCALISSLILFPIVLWGQGNPIQLEKVRKDILSHPNNPVPERFVVEARESLFGTVYSKDLCFVHRPFKDYSSEPNMKSAALAMYRLNRGIWILQNIVPYYYNFSLLNERELIFLSKNLFCDPNGACRSYVELSKFRGRDLIALISYFGFDKTRYYNRLTILDKTNEVKKFVGDTIANEIELSDFDFVNVRKSFLLRRKFTILLDVNDSLVTRVDNSKRKIILDQ